MNTASIVSAERLIWPLSVSVVNTDVTQAECPLTANRQDYQTDRDDTKSPVWCWLIAAKERETVCLCRDVMGWVYGVWGDCVILWSLWAHTDLYSLEIWKVIYFFVSDTDTHTHTNTLYFVSSCKKLFNHSEAWWQGGGQKATEVWKITWAQTCPPSILDGLRLLPCSFCSCPFKVSWTLEAELYCRCSNYMYSKLSLPSSV